MENDTKSEILRLLVRVKTMSTVQILMHLGFPADMDEALEDLESRGYLSRDGDCWSLNL